MQTNMDRYPAPDMRETRAVRERLGTGRHESDASLHSKDIAGLVLATIMTLGPLVATATIGI